MQFSSDRPYPYSQPYTTLSGLLSRTSAMRISMFSKISRILGSDLAAFREVSDSCRVSVTSYHCSVVCSHVPALLHGSCTGHVHANTQWYISAIVMIIIIIHEPIYTLLCANFDNNFSSIITESVLRAHLMTVQAVVGSIVWAFRRLKKPRSREMSVRGYALHSVRPQLSFFHCPL